MEPQDLPQPSGRSAPDRSRVRAASKVRRLTRLVAVGATAGALGLGALVASEAKGHASAVTGGVSASSGGSGAGATTATTVSGQSASTGAAAGSSSAAAASTGSSSGSTTGSSAGTTAGAATVSGQS